MEKTCCFFGHRKPELTRNMGKKLRAAIEELVEKEKVDTFLFGSNSLFNDLCHEVVSELMGKYRFIKRVYVRAHFPNIDQAYRDYLLESYEDTYYPEHMLGAGKAAYVERNREMIDKSKFCIIYFDKKCAPLKSGTAIACDYATRKGRSIINIFEEKTAHGC